MKIEVTVKEFLEIVPIISEKLDDLFNRLRQSNLSREGHNYYDPELNVLDQRIRILTSFLKKFEDEMISGFEPKPTSDGRI